MPPPPNLQPSATRRSQASTAAFWFRALGALVLIAAPLLALVILHRLWIRRRRMVGLAAKLTGCGPALPRGGILIHGVSLGEVALMKPLLPLLPEGIPRILTTSTETGTEGLAKAFPDAARAHWPLDLPWAVSAFLRRTRPRLVVLLEAELWPLALLAARAEGIPVVVLNARSSARSHARWRWLRPIARRLVGSLAFAVAQNGTYAARLCDVGLPRARVAVSGSLKADMVRPAAPAAAVAEVARIALPDGPLLLIASTSEPEETAPLTAWRDRLRPLGWSCVVVLRHPERGPAVLERCRSLGLSARCTGRPDDRTTRRRDDVIIVDEIGRLGALYAVCAARGGISVVGGSLGSGRGGQNMLEPAAAGCCTVVGWDTRAQPDPMHLLRQAEAVVELSPATLADQLAALAADPLRRADLAKRAQAAWAGGRGALARSMRILAASDVPLLGRPGPDHPRA